MTIPHFHLSDDISNISDYFEQHGFVVFDDAYTNNECEQLIERMRLLVDQKKDDELGTFFVKEDAEHANNQYLFDSGGKISLFLEKGITPSEARKDLFNSLNKVGHALHDLDDVFSNFTRREGYDALAKAIGLTTPLVLESMFIFKSAKVGGEITPHQDGTFLNTVPDSVVGFWVALQDATIENGCLHVADAEHKLPLREIFCVENGNSYMKSNYDAPFPDDYIPVEVKAGALVLLHGRLPHKSKPNLSGKSRYAYTFHVIDGACEYPSTSLIQRPKSMPLQGIGKT